MSKSGNDNGIPLKKKHRAFTSKEGTEVQKASAKARVNNNWSQFELFLEGFLNLVKLYNEYITSKPEKKLNTEEVVGFMMDLSVASRELEHWLKWHKRLQRQFLAGQTPEERQEFEEVIKVMHLNDIFFIDELKK